MSGPDDDKTTDAAADAPPVPADPAAACAAARGGRASVTGRRARSRRSPPLPGMHRGGFSALPTAPVGADDRPRPRPDLDGRAARAVGSARSLTARARDGRLGARLLDRWACGLAVRGLGVPDRARRDRRRRSSRCAARSRAAPSPCGRSCSAPSRCCTAPAGCSSRRPARLSRLQLTTRVQSRSRVTRRTRALRRARIPPLRSRRDAVREDREALRARGA